MKFKRRKYLVDKKFQLNAILIVYITIILAVFLLSLYLIQSLEGEIKGSAVTKLTHLQHTYRLIRPALIRGALIIIFLSFIFVGIKFLLYTHRIIGPINRYKEAMKKVKEGDLRVRIEFRKKDILKDVGTCFSEMVDSLHKRVKSIKNKADKIQRILNKKEPTKIEIEKLKKEVAELHKSLENFKV